LNTKNLVPRDMDGNYVGVVPMERAANEQTIRRLDTSRCTS
jgi:hypothetical protein